MKTSKQFLNIPHVQTNFINAELLSSTLMSLKWRRNFREIVINKVI
jgi:hypothetical protein